MKPNEIRIVGRLIGEAHPPLVIAELGINHEGDVDLAIHLAETAIDAGAEFIKHQTHIVEDEMSVEAKLVIPGNADVSIWEIMDRCALSEEEERKLMGHIVDRGAVFISTPFSRKAVDRLERFGVPAYKIGSGECNNYPLVKYVASMGKPVILSTGMNSIETISPSVDILRSAGVPFALMHTTNLYPTPEHLIRLGALDDLRAAFPDAVLGLSDHSTSNSSCLAAVALGASILERHYTDTRTRVGPDIPCSMDTTDLINLISGSQEVFLAKGGSRIPTEEEAVTIAFAFASVVADKDLLPGDVLGPHNIWVRRPSGGDFSAKDYEDLFGAKVTERIPKNTQIRREQIELNA